MESINEGTKKRYSKKRKRDKSEDMADLESSAKRTTKDDECTEEKWKDKHHHRRRHRSVEDSQPREHMKVLDTVTGHVKVAPSDPEDCKDDKNVDNYESVSQTSGVKVKENGSEPVKNTSKVTKEVALEYLHLWNNRETSGGWSFKKKTQYWLLHSMYHKSKVPKIEFEILLKYLEGLKGHQRELAVGKAHRTIEQEGEVSKRRYKRAVAILEALA